MTDKTHDVPERYARIRERSAFDAGAMWQASLGIFIMGEPHAHATGDKDTLYPLHKITRARVVMDEFGVQWTLRAGLLRQVGDTGRWMSAPSRGRVVLWADLYAHPTEEVDDDEFFRPEPAGMP